MQPADVFGNRYGLLDTIGQGGMATVYRAFDHPTGRTVAVKVLRQAYSADPKFVIRFQREAEAAAALQHPNIVQVLDFGLSHGCYYIVMELVQGTDLYRRISHERRLDSERAIEIAHGVALGLGMAHRLGIVHRDVKPPNILLSTDGLVKLTDFGIASAYKDAHDARLTTAGIAVGTALYSAPEQAQGKIVHPPADVYALGVVLYEMLCGRTPFDGDSSVDVAIKHVIERPEPPRHLIPALDRALERVVMRCLEKDPRHRYADGDALAHALEQVAHAPLGRLAAPGAPQSGVGSAAAMGPATAHAPHTTGAPPVPTPPQNRSLAEQETTLLSPRKGGMADQETTLLSLDNGGITEAETRVLGNRNRNTTDRNTGRHSG